MLPLIVNLSKIRRKNQEDAELGQQGYKRRYSEKALYAQVKQELLIFYGRKVSNKAKTLHDVR